MARKVRCQVTKEWGTSDTFYKAPNGKYYIDEKIYLKVKKDAEYRNLCIDTICSIAEYAIVPPILNKIINSLGKAMGYDVLYETILRNKKNFIWANANKKFDSEVHRLLYYQGILKNSVIDVFKEFQNHNNQTEKENPIIPPENLDVGIVICKGEDHITDILGDI